MNKKYIIIGLVFVMLILGGAAIYIGVQLGQQPTTTPEEAAAYSYGECTERCNGNGCCQMPNGQCSGPICMLGVNFSGTTGSCKPGQLMNCYAAGPTCESIADLDPDVQTCLKPCLPNCPSGEHKVNPDGNTCPGDSHKVKGSCEGCNNPYWGCCAPDVITETPTPTKLVCGQTGCLTLGGGNSDSMCEGWFGLGDPRSYVECNDGYNEGGVAIGRCEIFICPAGQTLILPCTCQPPVITTITPTPSRTATPSPSGTITPTPTELPPTALVSDEADRVIIGAMMILAGFLFFRSGLNIQLGQLFWKLGGNKCLPNLNEAYLVQKLQEDKKKISREREDFEEKFDTE